MSPLFHELAPAGYLFLLLFILWSIGSILSSVASGWFALSHRFSSSTSPCGEIHTVRYFFRPTYLRFWIHGSGLRITADKDALYLSVFFPFRLGRPPLRIPWEEIQFSKSHDSPLFGRNAFIFREHVVLTLGNQEKIPLRISPRTALDLGVLNRVPEGTTIEVEPNFDNLPDDFPDPTIRKPR